MNIWVFQLSELPFHLDIVAFWVIMLSLGLGTAFGIRAVSDALSRTDRMTAAAGSEDAPVPGPKEALHLVRAAPGPQVAAATHPALEKQAA